MDVNIFRAIGELAVSAKRRTDKQYADFLAFYRQVVETLPTEMVEIFGELDVPVKLKDGTKETNGLLLTATDYMWWKRHIETFGMRFTYGPMNVEARMLEQFSKSAETHMLSPEERKNLIALLEQARA